MGCIRSGGQNELLEFKITQSSAKILFFIKKKLGFGTVRVQDKQNKTHCFKVNNKNGLEKIISLLNGNLCLESKKRNLSYDYLRIIKYINKRYYILKILVNQVWLLLD